ncbi:MAG: hypothetical protein ABR926_24375 [Streptosporangiaceae bacterium]|jgi:hypothetical protein
MDDAENYQFNHNSKQLEILLADYQTCREDERVHISIQAALFSVYITAVGFLIAAVTQTCEFSRSKTCIHAPDYLLAAAPLIPIALLAYTTIIAVSATLRWYYMRGLEDKIRKYTDDPIIGHIKPYSYIGILTEVVSLRRGRFSYRLLVNLLLAIVIAVFGGFTAYIGFHVKAREQIAMVILYSGIAALLVWEVALGTVRGRTFFIRTAEQFLRGAGDTRPPEPGIPLPAEETSDERSLLSYLLFPRPEDWIKWLIAPGAFLATAWSTASLDRWPTFLATWLILEYLIYGARYQWNDVRGVEEDQSHHQRRARARLPVGAEQKHIRRNVWISMSVAVFKLAMAVVLSVVLGLYRPVLLLIVLVLAIAVLYEALRSRQPSKGSKKRVLAVAIWCVVGLGYGVRGGTGIIIGGLAAANWETIVGIMYFVIFGIMFVLMTWVLEAADSCIIDSGKIWRIRPDEEISLHLDPLLKCILTPGQSQVTPRGTPRGVVEGPPFPGGKEPILDQKIKLWTPWNFALVVSALIGSVLGLGLAHVHPQFLPYVLAISFSLFGSSIMAVAASDVLRFIAVAAGAFVLIIITVPAMPSPLALLAGAPWLATTLLYAIFRRSSYQDLKNFLPEIIAALAALKILLGVRPLLLMVIIGSKTWDAINARRP